MSETKSVALAEAKEEVAEAREATEVATEATEATEVAREATEVPREVPKVAREATENAKVAADVEGGKCKQLWDAIRANYKTWIAVTVALVLLTPESSPVFTLSTFVVLMCIAHLFHYCAHWPCAYPYNITHIYHHKNNNFFSHSIQAVIEFTALLFFLFLKTFCGDYLHLDLSWLNAWVILFFYVFYTTVHNINYSYFHVNNVHEIHHQVLDKNMGPDICDVLFNTKQGPVENTDHYLYNVFGAFGLVYLVKGWYARSSIQPLIENVGKGLYVAALTVIGISSIVLYIQDQHKLFLTQYT